MDKLHEESRKQFENEMASRGWSTQTTSAGDYIHERVALMWMSWQASRASIVVELPRPSCVYADHSYPAYSQKQVEDLLNSIGLSIKGE
ncbi:Uncharacterised protein [Serratia entomophila]|nr:Uncharacterised protein [Serratia entomophila]CAI1570964.1 Uncharacterised protein [Serratia entomophila]CAI1782561.1 Uncharacterised protein [Serratia entomophila]